MAAWDPSYGMIGCPFNNEEAFENESFHIKNNQERKPFDDMFDINNQETFENKPMTPTDQNNDDSTKYIEILEEILENILSLKKMKQCRRMLSWIEYILLIIVSLIFIILMYITYLLRKK